MPIVGNLAEFPLPEVLLLIGTRTGRLRLYDVPEFGSMELDLSAGNAQALHLGGSSLFEEREIVTPLSAIVGAGDGMFEFRTQPVVSVPRQQPLPVNSLVMMLVLYVDEILAKQRALLTAEPWYRVANPLPSSWIDPELNVFFHQCKPLLAEGARAEDIAAFLEIDGDQIRLNLAYLRQVGYVEMLEGIEPTREIRIEREITRKTGAFQLAAEASDIIRRSGALLKIPARPGRTA